MIYHYALAARFPQPRAFAAPVSNPLSLALPGNQLVQEDGALTFAQPSNPITVASTNGGTLSVLLSAGNGTFTPSFGVAGVTVTQGQGWINLAGLAVNVNAVLSGMVYRPAPDWSGEFALQAMLTQGIHSLSGQVLVSVSPVTDAYSDTATTMMDTAVSINVLANDTFSNAGATISHVNGIQIANGGAEVTLANGGIAKLVNGVIVYTPPPGFIGTVPAWTYTVTSGEMQESASVVVTVTDQDPVAVSMSSVSSSADYAAANW